MEPSKARSLSMATTSLARRGPVARSAWARPPSRGRESGGFAGLPGQGLLLGPGIGIFVDGLVVGEQVFLGLFTSAAYMQRPREIPLLRDKVTALFKTLPQKIRSQIVPVILGDDARTMAVAAALQEAGFDVRGIRPPTVPAGTSRLRISLTLNIGRADIAALGRELTRIMA